MASAGSHIKCLRTAKHMTQEALAQKMFVTRQAVSAWETGKTLPDVRHWSAFRRPWTRR